MNKTFFTKLLNTIYPHLCIKCNVIISDSGLCHKCWSQLKFVSTPACSVCATPFEYEVSVDMLCGKCIQDPPKFDKAYYVMVYDKNSKKIIHKFKYSDQTYLAKIFSDWLRSKLGEDINQIDYLTCVPMHKFKLFLRKYNQAALLAVQLSKTTGKEFLYKLLIKHKNTKRQTELSGEERIKNIKGTIKINESFIDKICGKNILLIDDVFTTGATVNECTKILKKHGAKKVFVATVAKNLQ